MLVGIRAYNLISYIRNLKREHIILLCIFLLAVLFRFYNLGQTPLYFHQDEVMNGYVGRFVLLNGKDIYGNSWPLLYFNRFGDYPPILPMYLSGIATFIFGVNEFAVRFPSAFFGSLLIFPAFFLGKLIFQDFKTALFSSFIIAIFPWHIVLSRATAEGILGLTVFFVALLMILKGIKEKNRSLVLFSLIPFFITYFLYPSFRVLTPLALFPTPFLIGKNTKRIRAVLIGSFLIFTLLTLMIAFTTWGKGRFLQTSVFSNQDIAKSINISNAALSNDEGSNSVFIARVFHNKITGYFNILSSQYLSYFSTEFLFTKGGLPFRYNVPDQGLLYKTVFFLIIAAFLPTKKKINKSFFSYLIWLLLIAPIPAALTVDDVPNVHRAVFMILPLAFLAGLGLANLEDFLKYKYKSISLAIVIVMIALTFESTYFLHQYFAHEASVKSILRNGGDKELMLFLKNNKTSFSKVIMPVYDTLPLYYLFYTNDFNKSHAGQFGKNIVISKIGNVGFADSWCPSKTINAKNLPAKTLVIDDGAQCVDFGGLKKIKAITRKDGTVAFVLLAK